MTSGQIIKIDTELFNLETVSATSATVNFRADNGSTAATHLINAPVYVWQVEPLAHQATLETAHYAYERRYGKSADNTATVTQAGIVLSPRDIPVLAQKFIESYMI